MLGGKNASFQSYVQWPIYLGVGFASAVRAGPHLVFRSRKKSALESNNCHPKTGRATVSPTEGGGRGAPTSRNMASISQFNSTGCCSIFSFFRYTRLAKFGRNFILSATVCFPVPRIPFVILLHSFPFSDLPVLSFRKTAQPRLEPSSFPLSGCWGWTR